MLLIGCLANGVFGILVAFVQNYPGFVTLWFLIGLFTQVCILVYYLKLYLSLTKHCCLTFFLLALFLLKASVLHFVPKALYSLWF